MERSHERLIELFVPDRELRESHDEIRAFLRLCQLREDFESPRRIEAEELTFEF